MKFQSSHQISLWSCRWTFSLKGPVCTSCLCVCMCFNGVVSCHDEDDDECSTLRPMVINVFTGSFFG